MSNAALSAIFGKHCERYERHSMDYQDRKEKGLRYEYIYYENISETHQWLQ
jgi:hypothetical protein